MKSAGRDARGEEAKIIKMGRQPGRPIFYSDLNHQD